MDQGGSWGWTNPEAQPIEQASTGPSRRQIASVAAATLAIAAGLLAFTILGGSGGSELSPIAQAAEKTADSSSGRMTMTASITSSRLSTPLQMSSHTAFDGAAGRMRGSFEISGPAPFEPLSISTVVSGDTLYLHSPSLPAPNGRTWMVAPHVVGKSDEESFGLTDPGERLEAIESVSDGIAIVGREQVRGRTTTHYVASLSLDKEAGLLRAFGDGRSADNLKSIAERALSDDIPINVWVDGRGLVRRLAFSIATAQAGGGSGSLDVSMDFFDFGSTPKITIPPTDQVYKPSQQLLDSLGG